MAVKNGYNPQPGQRAPQKYPFTGPNYQQYGEQPGYVYYPWKDEYYVDPKAAKEYGQANGTIAPDPEKPSLGNTVLPIAAAAGALAVGQGLGKDPTGFVKGIGEGLGLVGGKDGGLLGIGGEAAQGAGTTAATAASQGANAALAGAGPGGLMSVGAEPALFAPEFGLGATGELAGAPAAAAAGAEGGGLFSLGGIGAGGNAILPAIGAIGAADLIANKRGGARGIIQGAGSGAMIGSYFNPLTGGLPTGTLIGAGVGGLIGLGMSAFNHETTRDVAKKHTNQLLKQGGDNPAWQGYVSGMREQHSAPPPDPSKPFLGGKYSTFNEYKSAGLNATDLSGVYGNLETYGPEWANLSQQQREQVTQANIDSGLYDSKKGEVVITNKDAARKNKERVLSGGQTTPPPGQSTRPATLPAGSAPKPNGLLSVGAR